MEILIFLCLIITTIGNSLEISLKNTCGTASHSFWIPVELVNSYYSYATVFPNPAFDILNITIDERAPVQQIQASKSNDNKKETQYDIQLYNIYGYLLRQTKAKAGTIQLNVSDLKNGAYFLNIYDGINDKPYIQTIMINRK
jgi:hypothetical protein